MDFLNQAISQISEVFRSLSVGARILASLFVALVVISVGYLFNNQVAAPDSYLFGGEAVAGAEIASMQAAFGKAGLKNAQIDGLRIRVPRGEESTYVAALAESNALPASFNSHMEKALADAGPWTNNKKMELQVQLAKQKDFQQIINKMPGVESSSVMYDVKDDGGLTRKRIYSASVTVKTKGHTPLDDASVQGIRSLVSSAFAGMSPESVAVFDIISKRPYPAGRAGQISSGSQDPYLQTKMAHEKEWREKIEYLLSDIPGKLVSVNVQLFPETVDEQHSVTFENKPVITKHIENSDTSAQTLPANGGRPGLQSQNGISNQGQSLTTTTSSGGTSTKESSTVNDSSVVPGSETNIKKAPLRPNTVTVSVVVPSAYYEKLWQKQNPTPTGSEVKKPTPKDYADIETNVSNRIKDLIAYQIPLPGGKTYDELFNSKTGNGPKDVDRIPLVFVTTLQQIDAEEIVGPAFSDTAMTWFGNNWSTLGTGMLGLFSLVMLRSLVKNVPQSAVRKENLDENTATANAKSTAAADVAATSGATDEPGAPQVKKLARRLKPGTSLRDELVEIVREDPDTAASVLKSWISNSA